jgi:predicted ATPase
VCASEDVPAAQALAVLSSLVDKSLVMRENAGGLACYRLHETMREFAALKLAEAGEADAVTAPIPAVAPILASVPGPISFAASLPC